MVTVIIFLIVLAVLIFVHELGHFLFAKMFGIRVDAFKIGFGPKIIAWTPTRKDGTKGETEYGINLIPFGGYVKIYGENPDQDDLKVYPASSPSYVNRVESRSLIHKAKWQQVLVLAGGVLFNVLFAWVLYVGLFTYGVTATADGFPGYEQYFSNQRIMTISDMQNAINDSEGKGVVLDIGKGNNIEQVTVTPTTGLVADKYAIGIAMNDVADMRLPFHISVYEGGRYTWETLKQTVVGLYGFAVQAFHGTANLSEVTGPVGIAGIVGDAARLGITHLLMITALISINLAIINIIPFPALDGGRIFFVAIESVIRRRIPASLANWTNLVGFSLLMLLMVVVTYRDIVRLIAG